MIPGIAVARILENFLGGFQSGRQQKEASAYKRQQDVLDRQTKGEELKRRYPYPEELAERFKGVPPDELDTVLRFLGKDTPSDIQWERGFKEKTLGSRQTSDEEDRRQREKEHKERMNLDFQKTMGKSDEESGEQAYSALEPTYRAALEQISSLPSGDPRAQAAIEEVNSEYQDAITSRDLTRANAIKHWMSNSPVFQDYLKQQSIPSTGGGKGFGDIIQDFLKGFSSGSQEG